MNVPIDWTKVSLTPGALIPQTDGSFQTVQGTGSSDGTFSIPNIPGGYYWLKVGITAFWTSSSTFDLGLDTNTAAPASVAANTTTTGMHFNLSGLDPLQAGDEVAFLWDLWPPFSLPTTAGNPAGGTTLSITGLVTSNIDFSQSAPAFLLQYEPESVGTLSALRLGTEATLPDLSFVNGVSNTVNQALVQTPQSSFDLNVKGSAWAALVSNAGPSLPNVESTEFEVTSQAFMTGGNVQAIVGMDIPLLVEALPSSSTLLGILPRASSTVCPALSLLTIQGFASTPVEPPILTDEDFGIVQYGDPFPTAWPRVFTFCQTATVPISLPGFATPASFELVNEQSSFVPTSPITPLISQVLNPTINGATIFSPASVAPAGVTLQWTAPSGQPPTGYKITAFIPYTLPNSGGQTYLPGLTFYTTKTSVLLPPLQAGKTYVFSITAILDGAANFETRPNRSALPTASVSVVSAPITTTSGP